MQPSACRRPHAGIALECFGSEDDSFQPLIARALPTQEGTDLSETMLTQTVVSTSSTASSTATSEVVSSFSNSEGTSWAQ